MSAFKINPDSVMLQQADGNYAKFLTILVWKLAKAGVRVTLKDLESFAEESQAGKAVLLTHGHVDSIEFKIVTAAEAERLAKYDNQQRGTA